MSKIKVKIIPYTGYGNKDKIYCRGRLIEDKEIIISKKDSIIKTLINSYKRVESDEIPFQKMYVKFANIYKYFNTNSEGYYNIKETIKGFESNKIFEPIIFEINKENFNANWENCEIKQEGQILFPTKKAKFGIISDIDDTILKTDVLSTLKWKIFYNTLFIKASKRIPIKNANLWYQKLSGNNKKNPNPFFYVSNSPWNLYEYLQEFLKVNKFPKGVVLLRDYGKNEKDSLQDYHQHKINEVENILKMYPKLTFILIGDGGQEDAHIYLKLKAVYNSQIKAIFIHRLGDNEHQKTIEELSKGHEKYFFFVKDSDEAIQICEDLKLI